MSISATENEFWQSDRLFRLLVTNAEEYAIFSMDLEGRITNWNRGAERLLGWSKEEAIGQSSAILFTEEDCAAGIPDREQTRAAEKGQAEDTRWHVKKNGKRFWANGVMTALENETGQLIGFAKILRDLTFQKRYEELLEEKTAALERANRALKQSNQRLESFASEVAHELRSPLTGMQLVLDSLSRECGETLDEGTTEMIRTTQESIRDLGLFADHLLSYARLGGDAEIELDRIASASVLDEALADLKPLIEARDAEVQVEELPVVWANPTLLRHLFRNLVGNAIRHNGAEAPRTWIEAKEQEDAWLFHVHDNGPGIPEQRREHVFSLLSENGTSASSSVSVGLALSKRIVDRHGGRIWLESTPGEGCTFFFTLPKRAENA